jgi:hypothetical protein
MSEEEAWSRLLALKELIPKVAAADDRMAEAD